MYQTNNVPHTIDIDITTITIKSDTILRQSSSFFTYYAIVRSLRVFVRSRRLSFSAI